MDDPLRFTLDEDEEIPLDDDPPQQNSALSTQTIDALQSIDQPTEVPAVPTPSSPPPASSTNDPLSSPTPPTTLGTNSSSSELAAGLESIQLEDSNGDRAHIQGAALDAAGPSERPVPEMHISVLDPVRRLSDHAYIPGLTSSHYEYLVATDIPGTGGDEAQRFEVRRRFKDFVALADLLEEDHRGYFIFPRPDKNTLEGASSNRTAAEFVEMRRLDLERYLRRLAAHPVVGRCDALRVFLQAEGTLAASFDWQQLQPFKTSILEGVARLPKQLFGTDSTVPTTSEVIKNPKHTNDFLRRLKELGEKLKQEYQQQHLLPQAEVALREEKAKAELYQERLAHASRKAEKLVKEFQRVGEATGDLGLSLIRLAKYEDEEGSQCGTYTDLGTGARLLATNCRRAGMAAVRSFRLSGMATSELMTSLEPLHDELAFTPAVVSALKEREAALLTVQSIYEDLDKKKVALAQLEEAAQQRLSGDPVKARKAQQLQNEIAALNATLSAAEGEYMKVKQRNEEELQRWQKERAAELQRLAVSFGSVSRAFAERAGDNWTDVAEELGVVQQNASTSPASTT